MDHKKIARDQVAYVLYSTTFFLVFAAVAVGLDLLSQWVRSLGVSAFTYQTISLTAHGILALDMLLFFTSLLISGWDFLKGLRR